MAGLSYLSLSQAQAGVSLPSPTRPERSQDIRVLLGNFSNMSVSGLDLLINGASRIDGNSVFSVRCGLDSHGNQFIAFGMEKRVAKRIDIVSMSGFLRLNGKLYRNILTIHGKGTQCAVVNTVDLEKYLAGLINREMMPSWPIEALKAQAVASRSYALAQMQNNRSKEFDVESTTQDQVYDGAGSETWKSNKAVDETRGLVLSYSQGPLKAYFHANCGGTTEVPEFVWGENSGKFRSVACPYHKRKRDRAEWSVLISRNQIESALRKISGFLPRSFVRLASLEAGAPNANNRLTDVVVSDKNGNNIIVPAQAFRMAMGNTKIKSTAFHIREERGGYRISGEGFGHGVGMCQVGARAMADAGKRFRQILAYYYPLAKIQSL